MNFFYSFVISHLPFLASGWFTTGRYEILIKLSRVWHHFPFFTQLWSNTLTNFHNIWNKVTFSKTKLCICKDFVFHFPWDLFLLSMSMFLSVNSGFSFVLLQLHRFTSKYVGYLLALQNNSYAIIVGCCKNWPSNVWNNHNYLFLTFYNIDLITINNQL